jgi:hypothetical protein
VDYDAIFEAYWTQYRGETDVPASTDPEYIVGIGLANEAINHWETYDGTFWKELFAYFKDEDGSTISTGVTQYDTTSEFKEAGGKVRVIDANGRTLQRYPIIDIHEAQFKGDDDTYAYFSGNPRDGYVLNLNPAPPSTLNGMRVDYPFYKLATKFATGTDVSEIPDPYFIVHRMLANRFRSSRNPYYNDAKKDAENSLGKMKTDNDSGSWSNPFQVKDRSGSAFGA